MSLSNGFVSDFDVRQTSTTKAQELGTLAMASGGRKYRYAKAGATALDAGKLTVAADVVANHVDIAAAVAAAIGDTSVSVTLGATAATANQYADGYLVVNDAAGEGTAYRIKGHGAHAGSGTLVVNLFDPIAVALTTSSVVSLQKNTFDAVVISATDQADLPAGVPNVPVAIGAYFWCQTGGDCAVLSDEPVTAGLAITTGTGVTGAVEAVDAAGEPQIGIAKQALVDTEYRTAHLSID